MSDSPHIRECLRVFPSTGDVDPETVNQHLISIHSMSKKTEGSDGALGFLSNSIGGDTPAKIECIVRSAGEDEPIEVYYSTNADLSALESQLQNLYPSTFDIKRTTIDLVQYLVRPVAFEPEDFADHLGEGNLYASVNDLADEEHPLTRADSEGEGPADGEYTAGPSSEVNDSTVALVPDDGIDIDSWKYVNGKVIDIGEPQPTPDVDELTTVDGPTLTEEGVVLARPDPDHIKPYAVTWEANEDKKKDWMTAAKTSSIPPSQYANNWPDQDDEFTPSPLIDLMEHLMKAQNPAAFQVIARPKPSFKGKASLRKENLKEGQDGLLQKLSSKREKTYEIEKERINLIEAKNTKRSFNVNVRLLSPHTPPDLGESEMPSAVRTFTDVAGIERLDTNTTSLLVPLDGEFYTFEGVECSHKTGRFSSESKAQKIWQQFLDREMVIDGKSLNPIATTHPNLVLSPRVLSELMIVPSATQFSDDLFRSSTAHHEDRSPLPCPSPDVINQFRQGATIGYPITEKGEVLDEPISLPKRLLQQHFAIFASSGSGKSIKIANILLSMHESVPGPEILFEPKGDRMCENYLRAYYSKYGNLDDVYYFEVPNQLPIVSFFDIRPALAAGRDRDEAIQDRINHFHSIMEVIMGEDEYDSAYLAKQIISYLIKAEFDEEYGSDAFTVDDLYRTADELYRAEKVPEATPEVEHALAQLKEKPERDFDMTLSAVFTRLNKLRENTHIYHMLNQNPEWGDEKGKYVEECFSFSELADNNVQILFATGGMRPETQHAFTLILLSTMWDDLQWRRRSPKFDDSKQVNLIIEEAATIASKDLVYKQLIPESRAFNFSLGFVMQFPSQVMDIGGERAYHEIMNNVQNKIYGKIEDPAQYLEDAIAVDEIAPERVSNKLKHMEPGEWIANLTARFDDDVTSPFSIRALDIPEGHPEGDSPLSRRYQDRFESQLEECIHTTEAEFTHSGTSDPTDASSENSHDGQESSPEQDANTKRSDSGSDTASAKTNGHSTERSQDQHSKTSTGIGDDPQLDTCEQCSESIPGYQDLCTNCRPSRNRTGTSNDIPADNTSASETNSVKSGQQQQESRRTNGSESSTSEEPPHHLEQGRCEPSQFSPEPFFENGEPKVTATLDSDDDAATSGKAWKKMQEKLEGGDNETERPESDDTATPEIVNPEEVVEYLEKVTEQALAKQKTHNSDTPDSSPDPIASTGWAMKYWKDQLEQADDETGDTETVETKDSDPVETNNSETDDIAPDTDASLPDVMPKAIAGIQEDELEKWGLSQDDADFLELLSRAYNRELEDYFPMESMKQLIDRAGEPDIEMLAEEDFIEVIGTRPKRFALCEKGWEVIEENPHQVGDWNEGMNHSLGVWLLEHWLEEKDEVENIETYYEYNSESIIDIVGLDDSGDILYGVEIECASNNQRAVVDHYQTLARVDCESVWIVDKTDTLQHITQSLTNLPEFPENLLWKKVPNVAELNNRIEAENLSGIDKVQTFSNLKRLLK